MTARIIPALAVLLAALTQGCSSPYKNPEFAYGNPGLKSFPGIAQQVAGTPGKTLDVIMVHGMCTHDDGWAKESISRLSKMMKGPANPVFDAPLQVEGTQTTVHRATLGTPFGTVHARAVVWSPVLAGMKRQLCYDQTDKSPTCEAMQPPADKYTYSRASFNRGIKDALMNDCLADVLIYQGVSREAISEQIQHALLAAMAPEGAGRDRSARLRAASENPRPIVFIAESLGSKVSFDAIYKLQTTGPETERTAATQLFDRFAQVFMQANQLPILSLADQHVGGTSRAAAAPAFPADPLAAIIRNQKSRSGKKIQVVAFSDPNDLLSYPLVHYRQVQPFEATDVIVSNSTTWFGLFENPYPAHTAYRDNDAVVNLIACGTEGCK